MSQRRSDSWHRGSALVDAASRHAQSALVSSPGKERRMIGQSSSMRLVQRACLQSCHITLTRQEVGMCYGRLAHESQRRLAAGMAGAGRAWTHRRAADAARAPAPVTPRRAAGATDCPARRPSFRGGEAEEPRLRFEVMPELTGALWYPRGTLGSPPAPRNRSIPSPPGGSPLR